MAVLLLTAMSWAAVTGQIPTLPATLGSQQMPEEAAASGVQRPTPGREAADQPLGTPAPTTTTNSSSYRFLTPGAGGEPSVAYDPCRPIHYVVRPTGAPTGGDQLITAAIARVSAATGLVFTHDGTTDENPTAHRAPYQPDVYGDQWAPVLIAWVTPDENPDFAGAVAGRAGSVAVNAPEGPHIYVTGQVQLDGQQLAPLLTQPDGDKVVTAIIQHELAHLVGLDHVNDPTQLMHPKTSSNVTDFSAGDLTGLAALGRGPCEPQL